jgi:addiction module RelE/StbE family toxin
MAKLIWTEKALCSLEAIYDYIAKDSVQYAKYHTRKIIESLNIIITFPESGKLLPEFNQSSYRQIVVGSYRIIYRFDRPMNIVYIINIVHGSRLLTDFHIVVSK